MKSSDITCTDNFCGAGGSAQGVRKAGVRIVNALNHWKLATETYAENNPDSKVYCVDVSLSDPRYFQSTTMAVMSPECTVHSPAGGNHYKALKKQMDLFEKGLIDPAADRSRMTMWDVTRFTEVHRYETLIIENVVEAKTRWPLFDVWLKAMHTMGYKHKLCFINSMHCHPTPQSRDRMYVVFWKKGNKTPDLEFTPLAWCQSCEKDVQSYQWWKNADVNYGKYRTQYLYRCPACTSIVEPYYHASFNIIDWSIPAKPVLDRDKPLSEPTLRRIEYGLKTFGHEYLVIGSRYKSGFECRVKTQFDPLPTQPTEVSHGVVLPFFINTDHSQSADKNSLRSSKDAMRAVTTAHTTGMVVPYITHAPIMIENNGQSNARSIAKAAPTQTTEMKHGILTTESFNAFLTYYNGNSAKPSRLTEGLGTITTRDRVGLVTHSKPTLEDCRYRTIRANEVKKAMAFEDTYKILGNVRDQVCQLGNAVTPPAMEWLTRQCVNALS